MTIKAVPLYKFTSFKWKDNDRHQIDAVINVPAIMYNP